MTSAKLDATGHRWLAELSNFDFSIAYRSGKENGDADILSRLPGKMETASEEVVKATCHSAQVLAEEMDCAVDVMCFSQNVIVSQQGLVDNQHLGQDQYDWIHLQAADPVLNRVKVVLESG